MEQLDIIRKLGITEEYKLTDELLNSYSALKRQFSKMHPEDVIDVYQNGKLSSISFAELFRIIDTGRKNKISVHVNCEIEIFGEIVPIIIIKHEK